MTRVIAFASSKGGSGKSTVVVNLGVAMARLGKKVVLVDADLMMSNLGLLLGLEGHKVTLHDVLAGEAKIQKAVCRAQEGVKVLSGGVALEGIQRAKLDHLKKVVGWLAKRFDYVFLDAPSGLDRDAITAMSLANELVMVVTPDIASLSNAIKTKLISERLNVPVTGVIVTRSTGKGLEIAENEIIMTLDLPVLAVIPEDPALRQASAMGEPVVTRVPRSPSAMEFKKLALEFKIKPGKRG
jgi:septum site-determining protein MinD